MRRGGGGGEGLLARCGRGTGGGGLRGGLLLLFSAYLFVCDVEWMWIGCELRVGRPSLCCFFLSLPPRGEVGIAVL